MMMRQWMAALVASVWLFLPSAQAQSGVQGAQESVMLEIAAELRCLVCQNESIAASRAELAVDLRHQIMEQLGQGRTPDQIRTYMVDRYGDFILYRPPFKASTVMLWLGPALLLLIGFLVYAFTLRRRHRAGDDTALTDEQRRQADALLQGSSRDEQS
ncbi:MAG: cytochrome c-type biogenesis protein CcmH [Alcaligenes faecalis]|jgi:cytochrome c-type biogenesis protein CcmH|uniref:Cytochrome c-type biogenesis protein n=3 Tax=Pseudomonadota TaxID=1224 RepID=A0A3G2HRU1_9BURK|nr:MULTISPECIES: cytochrome c-type biogenesis protein [Alcaligenes]ASR88498.1 cytochrome C biogenesis protein cycl [Alcaligenes faecalis]AWG35766.1 cytochrome C biogenesis protein cycl [Alcaligenes aquatilis]AYN19767.1 cytochrome c-type biogenesis protein CcmH [Alcaligenes aquatilis]MCC9163683.1 cytochrome c-type biogenesis protein CcmH [Alcaligenes sp. MMA]MCH4225155.1 cytochrome c-type biogenesis protein CcmH [Alcaligenes faecalis]